MTDPVFTQILEKLRAMRRDLQLERLRRFDLSYPPGHSEREMRMPAEIRVLRAQLEAEAKG